MKYLTAGLPHFLNVGKILSRYWFYVYALNIYHKSAGHLEIFFDKKQQQAHRRSYKDENL
jgi:hypothetical protein